MASKNGARSASKMVFNDDGTIGVPVRGEDGKQMMLTLHEPTLDELAVIHEAVVKADNSVPQIPTLGLPPGADATREEKQQYLAKLQEVERISRERAADTYGTDSPYGAAFITIVSTLSGTEVDGSMVYGWAMNPRACREVLEHFKAPLDGPDDAVDPLAILKAVAETGT